MISVRLSNESNIFRPKTTTTTWSPSEKSYHLGEQRRQQRATRHQEQIARAQEEKRERDKKREEKAKNRRSRD